MEIKGRKQNERMYIYMKYRRGTDKQKGKWENEKQNRGYENGQREGYALYEKYARRDGNRNLNLQ